MKTITPLPLALIGIGGFADNVLDGYEIASSIVSYADEFLGLRELLTPQNQFFLVFSLPILTLWALVQGLRAAYITKQPNKAKTLFCLGPVFAATFVWLIGG